MYRTRLDLLARRSLLRRLRTIHSAPLAEVQREGHQVLLFSSNNYLDLATHPKVAEAAITGRGCECKYFFWWEPGHRG